MSSKRKTVSNSTQDKKDIKVNRKRINIRISEVDLDMIKQRATQEGIPYQTLIASVLHKYVSGNL